MNARRSDMQFELRTREKIEKMRKMLPACGEHLNYGAHSAGIRRMMASIPSNKYSYLPLMLLLKRNKDDRLQFELCDDL